MKSFFIFSTSGSFTTGAIGGQIDKYPIQEVGDEDHRYPDAYPQTDKIRESELLSNVLPLRDRLSMSPDEIKMGSNKPQLSQLLVYDRGKHPGRCVIFNNKTFVKEATHPTRDGTDKDKDLLEQMFQTYGYEVFVFNDKSCPEILQILETFQSSDHQDYGSFIVCTLSHGDLDVISGCCGGSIDINSMTSLFRADNCPSLAGKPKIFIYQACQGKCFQNGKIMGIQFGKSTYSENKINKGHTENKHVYLDVWHRTDNITLANSDTHLTNGKQDMTATVPDFYPMCFGPAEADFLIAHSTMPGYVSLRNEDGSFFIQSLVKNIKELSPREDLVSILAEVNRDVSEKIGKTSDDRLASQIPEARVRLTRKFYLTQDRFLGHLGSRTVMKVLVGLPQNLWRLVKVLR
ncbi:caspase-3-like [Crassostrea virginica]